MKTLRGPGTRALVVPLCLSASVLLLGTATRADAAGDPKTGRAKARPCEVCHGLDGQSKVPEAPNLAGQIELYLETQLRAFKSGERKSEVMSAMASTLSPQDIQDLAAFYSAIEITVGKVPGE